MTVNFKGREITRDSILEAMNWFDASFKEGAAYENWHTYAVEHNGKIYAPKAILGRASSLETTEFAGGEPTNRVFRDLGFNVSKRQELLTQLSLRKPDLHASIAAAFEVFKDDPVYAFYVRMRRDRAAIIKRFLSDPDALDLPTFYAECWRIGEFLIADNPIVLSIETLPDLERTFDEGTLKITGHLVWRQGSGVFAPSVPDPDVKLSLLKYACRILTSTASLDQQVQALKSLEGFGNNLATGYVMLFHPDKYAVYNTRSQSVLRAWGHDAHSLDAFEVSMQKLKDTLGAQDFLELDHFISLVSDKQIMLGEQSNSSVTQPGLSNNKPRMWWVNQGSTFESAFTSQTLWVPVKNKSGQTFKHWTDLSQAQPGDTVLHYANGYLVATSTVQAAAEQGSRPGSSGNDPWEDVGYVVYTRYQKVDPPTALADIPHSWRQHEEGGPFTRNGSVKQGYFFPLSQSFTLNFRRFFPDLFGRRVFKISPGEGAILWPKWVAEGLADMGWNKVGDLRNYNSREALRDQFEQDYGEECNTNASTITTLSKDLWAFRNLQPGDVLVANQGKQQVLAVGVVQQGGYTWLPHREPHHHTVTVDWDTTLATSVDERGDWVKAFIELTPSWYRANALSTPQPRAWIFQANPNVWSLERALTQVNTGDEDTWTVSRYRNQIQVGDTLYLWQSGAAAGLYAVGEVTGQVFERAASEWRKSGAEREQAVPFRYTQILNSFIPRTTFLSDAVLKSAAIIQQPQATNFSLTPEEEGAIRTLLEERTPEPVFQMPNYQEPSFEEISQRVKQADLQLDERTLRRYHYALKASKFVILSGISGTGKTWLTQVYADAVGAPYRIVAVAPNWISNEDLLGYQSFMHDQYVDTAFSHFLRDAEAEYRACGDGARPYHVILDEMNLARVEYYFTSFLSAMELRARGTISEISLGDRSLPLPPNLVFIGTVNIDETTHVFADKVYDRAQLIELTVNRAQLETYLDGLPHAHVLLSVWDAVHAVGPFAFRVLSEINRYINLGLQEDKSIPWEETLDEQLLQKVLPKIKGTEENVETSLRTFLALAENHGLPLSAAKAKQMLDRYALRGITSFF